jgi:hypothetical protein
MELYPICDEALQISPNIWYVLSNSGQQPSMRVGHCVVHIDDSQKDVKKGRIVLIGGANPTCCFNDVFCLDLDTFNWIKLAEKSSLPRACYEHSAFVDTKSTMYVFGGSCETGNLNETLKYDNNKWTPMKFDLNKNRVPSSRTQHVGCRFRGQLVVFGGGECGSSAVNDQNVYVFNPLAETWSIVPIVSKQRPNLRHGHLLLAHMDRHVYLHGGMHDNEFFNDLWILNLDSFTWSCIIKSSNTKSTSSPCARAAHGGLCTNKYLYIYGGLDKTHVALNDFWKFEVKTNTWSTVNIVGDNPPPRLDYAFCKLTLHVVKKSQEQNEEPVDDTNQTEIKSGIINVFDSINPIDDNKFAVNNNNDNSQVHDSAICNDPIMSSQTQESESNNLSQLIDDCPSNIQQIVSDKQSTINDLKEFFFIHGGMDTLGNIFDDCFIINLPE